MSEPHDIIDERGIREVLVDPHYVQCLAVMCDASDMLGAPPAVYVGPSGVHWVRFEETAQTLNESPAGAYRRPWQSYVHSDVSTWWYEERYYVHDLPRE